MIQEIKDFINQNIKENGKGGITGTILNSVLNKIADALPSSASAGLKNLVDGEADGSVRGVYAAEETEEYKLGQYSVAEGYNTKASGDRAHAEGFYTEAIGSSSHAEGEYSKAIGSQCHAEGCRTEAHTEASHAEGYGSQAKGAYSHAEGYYTESARYAHSECNYTKALGWASHAEGDHSQAEGDFSHAEGYRCTAKGMGSHAGGKETIAIGQYQTAIGVNNKEIDALFSVGDGESNDKRSDAFRVEKDSKVMIKNNAGEEVHLQDFEPRSCIIRWQPQSEIKDEMYFLYHDLVYMPMFDNLQDGERHILHLDWLYEHQVALDDAERTDGGSVEYIGGERLHSVLTVRKYAGNMYCELTTKVVETTRRNDDAHQNRFHTPQIRYNYADDRTHTRASRVYLQDYIFSERFNYDGENAVGTHFKLTLVSALLDGSPVPLTQFVFADNTGNVDYYRDEEGNENSNATSDGRYVYNADSVGDTDISVKVRVGDKTQTSKFTLNSVISDHEITIDVPEQEVDVIKELEAANLLGAMQGKSVCRQTTADGYAVMASIFQKEDSSLGDYDKCVLVFGYAGQDNDGNIKEFGELTIDLRNGFDLTYSGSNKSELKVKKYDGIMYQRTISIMSNCKANEFRALYLKSSVQIDAKQTEPLLTFNVPASKGYITAVVADSSVQGQSPYINQVASVAEQIADKLPYANPFYYSDYSTDYYDAETQTLTLLEGKTMAHIYPAEPLMVKHIVLPEVKTGQRLAIYGNWIPVVEDGDEQEGRFSAAWRTDVANGFEDLIYLNGQWINKA